MNEELVQALRALSNIEWYLIKEDKQIHWGIIWEHFDYIFNYLIKTEWHKNNSMN